MRRDLGGVRSGSRLAEARRDDLLLAEGARRRSGARHDHPQPARGRAARDLQAGLAAAQGLPHDQGRQTDRRNFRGRDDQQALDVVRRGLYRRAPVGQERRRAAGPVRARRRQRQGDRRLGGQDAVGAEFLFK